MYRNRLTVLFSLLSLVLVSACGILYRDQTQANMPNPASVFCEENGGIDQIRADESGGEAGLCIFPDGSFCDEWAYFRGECAPGDSLLVPTAVATLLPEPSEAAEPVPSGWIEYRSENPPYHFLYPEGSILSPTDNPLGGISIDGPLVGEDHWPVFYITHPSGRAEFSLPEGADLEQWLVDHNLLAEPPLPGGRQIAGTDAIQIRFERSQQSYAYDRFFFAHQGQIYEIIITHTGDREDWDIYDTFLDSFQFDD